MISFQKCTKDEFENIVIFSKVESFNYNTEKTLKENIDLFFQDPDNTKLNHDKVIAAFENKYNKTE